MLTLNSGRQMPQLGLGTYGLSGRAGTDAVIAAADIGYRLFDTAVRYGNEAAVGAGVKASGVHREELFVTTKFDGEFQGGRRAERGLDESLRPAGPRLRRLDPDPLASAAARPLRRHVEDVRAVARRWQDTVDRCFELQAHTPRPAAQGHRHRSGREPNRARPDDRESRCSCVPRSARHRDPSLEPTRRPRRGRRPQCDHHRDRACAWPHASTSRVALGYRDRRLNQCRSQATWNGWPRTSASSTSR